MFWGNTDNEFSLWLAAFNDILFTLRCVKNSELHHERSHSYSALEMGTNRQNGGSPQFGSWESGSVRLELNFKDGSVQK